jgi:hypothetical protein
MKHRCLVALLLAGWQHLALAASPPAAAEDPQATPEVLYQEALQSLAEGRKYDASRALTRLIAQEPQHAGAYLDLALIQCSLGYEAEAERLFAIIETRFSPSRPILELIAEARDTGCRKWQAASSLSVSIGRGVDDNVNQGASNSSLVVRTPEGEVELPLLEDFLPKRDQYSMVSADYVRDITANGSLGFVQFQQRRYDRLRDYDVASLYGGVESPWRFGDWVLRTTGTLGMTTLGSKLYQRQGQLQVRITPPLSLPADTQMHFTAGASRLDYASLRAFSSDVLEARALVIHQAGQTTLSVSAGLQSDRARNLRPGGNRHGSLLTLSARRFLAWDTTAELSYTRQTWDSASPYSPELLLNQVRAQRTQILRAALSYQVGKYHYVVLEGRGVRNRENISIFQYNNRQFQLSWQWRYP